MNLSVANASGDPLQIKKMNDGMLGEKQITEQTNKQALNHINNYFRIIVF